MANEVQISGDILRGVGWLESEAPRYFKRALTRGAIVLKDRTRQNLQSVLPASSNHNPKYNDTLQDAIRNSKVSIDQVTVHILGTRNSGSGTYRTRFFEGGTKSGTRYQKTINGKRLKNKRFVGRLNALGFFSSAISSSGGEVINVMQQTINEMLDEANKQ